MNHSDSQRIRFVLEKFGIEQTENIKETNFLIINMCSVRQSAVDRVYGKIRNFNKIRSPKKQKTILTGCILKKDLLNFKKYFDFILPIKELYLWPEILKIGQALKVKNYLDIPFKKEKKFSVFIPISNGCNNFCTYCVVPYTRGPLVCRDHKKIVQEVKEAVKNKAKEIWLLGQNVNDYKSKIINFAKLLKIINKIEGDFWIRFTSPNPADFSNELIETMARCKKVTPCLNLPLQSGDDKILKKMNRKYTVKEYKNLVKKIRGKIPNIALSTDIIVGFPGETKKQFANTAKLFKEIKFDMAYIAQYSVRTGTIAEKMNDNVPKKEKERREKILTEILKKTALEKNKKYIGKKIEVLVVKHKTRDMKHFYIGKTQTNKTVMFQVSDLKLQASSFKLQDLVGQFRKVKIIEAKPFGLKAELLI